MFSPKDSGRTTDTRRGAPHARRVRFIAGVALIAVSFLVYPAYSFIILFPPFSGGMKVSVIVAASLLSWGVFSAGIFLAGREGYDWLKELWKPRSRGRQPDKSAEDARRCERRS